MQYLERRLFRTLICLFKKLHYIYIYIYIYIITPLHIFSLLILSHPHTALSLFFLLIYNFCTYLSVDPPCMHKNRVCEEGYEERYVSYCFLFKYSVVYNNHKLKVYMQWSQICPHSLFQWISVPVNLIVEYAMLSFMEKGVLETSQTLMFS